MDANYAVYSRCSPRCSPIISLSPHHRTATLYSYHPPSPPPRHPGTPLRLTQACTAHQYGTMSRPPSPHRLYLMITCLEFPPSSETAVKKNSPKQKQPCFSECLTFFTNPLVVSESMNAKMAF
eukprot:scaffold34530_cov129-Isochrysis_galbana.AAC.3